mgnify:CR=1 FL=1
MKKLIEDSLQNSFSYSEYRKKVSDLLANGQSSGNEQSEDLLHYSQLNEVRMNRLDKTIEVTPENHPLRIVDYGNGTCDATFTVTVNGQTYTFN